MCSSNPEGFRALTRLGDPLSLCSYLPVLSSPGMGRTGRSNLTCNLSKGCGRPPELSLKGKGIFFLLPEEENLFSQCTSTPSFCADELNFLFLLMKVDQSQTIYSRGNQAGELSEGVWGQKQLLSWRGSN